MGYSVMEANSGSDALASLERDDPCDLVLMDQVMPGLSGQDTVCLARRTRPDLKVLFMSGYGAMTGDGMEAGHDIWLKKPFTVEVLTEAISSTLYHDQ
jgi:two-component system cell cycle sensor histidine kinase/response regulator CckA